MSSTLKLTDEQRRAIASEPNGIARVEDEQTQKVYLFIEEDCTSLLYDHWLRHQLQAGFDESERGETAEWNVEAFLANMHAQHAAAD